MNLVVTAPMAAPIRECCESLLFSNFYEIKFEKINGKGNELTDVFVFLKILLVVFVVFPTNG